MQPDHLHKTSRFLPHWQVGGSTYFITFRLHQGKLEPSERDIVSETVLHDACTKYSLYAGVVMPDHVHLLLQPLEISLNKFHDLSKIMKTIKGVSARRINLQRGTFGKLWQEESYDHVIRNQRALEETWKYIYENPVTADLVKHPEMYRHHIPAKVADQLP